jgi:SAM-dependent methyltransferase
MFETLSECPICSSSNSSVKYDDVCDYLNEDVEMFTVSTCFDCYHTYLGLRPYSHDIGRYYKTGYYTHKKSKGFSLYFGYFRNWIKSKLIKRTSSKSFGNGMFLDIGCGSGVHLADYERDGWKVHGVEIDQAALAVAVANHSACKFESDPFNKDSFGEIKFDLVNLSHVLEHLYDLHEFMGVLVKKTSNNAKVIIAVPRFESLERRIFGKYWRGLEAPRHLHHFNRDSLISLFESYSFKLESCNPQSLPLCFAESLYFYVRYHLRLKMVPKDMFVNVIYYLSYIPHKMASKVWSTNSMILTFEKAND